MKVVMVMMLMGVGLVYHAVDDDDDDGDDDDGDDGDGDSGDFGGGGGGGDNDDSGDDGVPIADVDGIQQWDTCWASLHT